jgi:2-polyprenyl-3-methyl-5-hydroxy-6-metoxy-1,4-benzoquinol methylase
MTNTSTIQPSQLEEGLAYAENNYHDPNSFSKLDKQLIKANFDLKGKDVLDFGCGMGHMSLWFAEEMGAYVDGVDIDENHLIVAQELNKKYKVPNVHFSLQNIISDPIEKQYDFIFLNDVIEHIISDWVEGVLDVLILNNLKPGGIIFFSYPPWEGPHAGHLQPATKMPWVHFLPHKMVLNIINRNNTQLVGRHNLLEHYLELNHMSHKKLSGYLRKYNLQQVFRKSHTKLNKISFFKNTNFNFFPFKYIVTKELIAFRKKG